MSSMTNFVKFLYSCFVICCFFRLSLEFPQKNFTFPQLGKSNLLSPKNLIQSLQSTPKANGIAVKNTNASNNLTPCTCAVFLSGQVVKNGQPKGSPALMSEEESAFACTPAGTKQCTNRCLEQLIKHLPNSATILCGTIDRDCHKERAYLFIQNCNSTWINTNLSAGREYCCKDGLSYKCPLLS